MITSNTQSLSNVPVLGTKELKNIFIDLVSKSQPSVFLELGAFSAVITRKISKLCPNTTCLAIEANPHNYFKYKDRFEKYSGPNARYIHKAISNTSDDFVTFHLRKNKNENFSVVNNSLLKKARNTQDDLYEPVSVSSTTAEQLIKDEVESFSDIIAWIDLEGMAYECLESFGSFLSSVSYCYIEVEDHQIWQNQKIDKEVFDFMLNNGFEAVGRDQNYPRQYNILFKRV